MTLTSNPGVAAPDVATDRTPSPPHRPLDRRLAPRGPRVLGGDRRPVARRNLVWSIFAEHLGFSVWLIWSVSSAFLVATGFDYSPQQLFLLVALPNLVGSLLRLPYTFAVPKFGGRNWTMASAALLLIPTLGFAYAVQHPGTPFWVFCLIAATAGLGGGNFASSMANINFFYPAAEEGRRARPQRRRRQPRGRADPALPAGHRRRRGDLRHRPGLRRWHPPRAGRLGVRRAGRRRDPGGVPLHGQPRHRHSAPREQLQVVRKRQTWIMAFLYIGTFGSFIGYSAAMPLLIKLNFWVPEPARSAPASTSPTSRSSARSSAPRPGRSAAGSRTGSAAPG